MLWRDVLASEIERKLADLHLLMEATVNHEEFLALRGEARAYRILLTIPTVLAQRMAEAEHAKEVDH